MTNKKKLLIFALSLSIILLLILISSTLVFLLNNKTLTPVSNLKNSSLSTVSTNTLSTLPQINLNNQNISIPSPKIETITPSIEQKNTDITSEIPKVTVSCPDSNIPLYSKNQDPLQTTLYKEQLDILNRKIYKYIYQNKNHSTDYSNDFYKLLFSRKNYFLIVSQIDSQSIRNFLFPKSTIDSINKIYKNCVENIETQTGYIDISQQNFNHDYSTFAILKSNEKNFIINQYGKKTKNLKSLQKSKITGYQLDNFIIFNNEDNTSFSNTNVLGETSETTGDQKVAVILVNFQNTTPINFDINKIKTNLFTNTNNYYKENSYGKMSISGDIFGPYTLPINNTNTSFDAIANESIKISDKDINFNFYRRIVIIGNILDTELGRDARATLGKSILNTQEGDLPISTMWVNYSDFGLSDFTLAHEFGHNLGLGHANFLDCKNGPIYSTTLEHCENVEYGNEYSSMGGAYSLYHFDTLQKDMLGWLDLSNKKQITQNGLYDIGPLEKNDSSIKTLIIQRDLDNYNPLYLEYRQSIGYDINIGTNNPNRINIYDGITILTKGIKNVDTYSNIISPNLPSDINNVTLKLNNTFVDNVTGTKITLVGKSTDKATIKIELGKTNFTLPSISLQNSDYLAYGSNEPLIAPKNFEVTADVGSPLGINRVEFSISTYKDGLSEEKPFAVITKAPFKTNVDTNFMPNGYNSILAKVYDNSGKVFNVEGNFNTVNAYFLVQDNDDTTMPVVTLNYPKDGQTYTYNGSSPTVDASITDNKGIYLIQFYIDGALVPDYDYKGNVYSFNTFETNLNKEIIRNHYKSYPPLSDGEHKIQIQVFDFAQNITTINATFNLQASVKGVSTISIQNNIIGTFLDVLKKLINKN